MSEGSPPAASAVAAGPVDLWADVVGQDDAVAQLRAAVRDPVHAYLLVGPPGSGRREAARAFIADLLTDGLAPESVERGRRLVAREQHPSMVVVERSGPFITMEQARELRKRAAMSPAEGDRQAFLLLDFHLVREAAGALLKTIEEPEPGTFLVLVAEELPAELATIASRCVRIDFGPIPTTVIAERLVAEGVEGARAEAAAASAGGSMARARTLIRDELLTARRDRWWSAPERLDGTGATAAALAEELADSVEEVVAPLAAAQAEERAVVEQQLEDYEIRGRGQLKVIDERHKREQKRIRTTELLAGMRTITDRYRSALDEGLDPSDYAAAADAVQRLCDSLRFNPNERLAMLALLLRLPQLPRRR